MFIPLYFLPADIFRGGLHGTACLPHVHMQKGAATCHPAVEISRLFIQKTKVEEQSKQTPALRDNSAQQSSLATRGPDELVCDYFLEAGYEFLKKTFRSNASCSRIIRDEQGPTASSSTQLCLFQQQNNLGIRRPGFRVQLHRTTCALHFILQSHLTRSRDPER